MTAVYTIWESEDEGFRMPSPKYGDGFRSLRGAMDAAQRLSGGHTVMWKEYIDEIGMPNGHGDVVAVFSDDKEIQTMEDALASVDGDKERLYAINWTFILKISAW